MLGLSQPQGHSAAGRIMSMKNSNDTIGNRTRGLPACSTVPQPTAPLCTPYTYIFLLRNHSFKEHMLFDVITIMLLTKPTEIKIKEMWISFEGIKLAY